MSITLHEANPQLNHLTVKLVECHVRWQGPAICRLPLGPIVFKPLCQKKASRAPH